MTDSLDPAARLWKGAIGLVDTCVDQWRVGDKAEVGHYMCEAEAAGFLQQVIMIASMVIAASEGMLAEPTTDPPPPRSGTTNAQAELLKTTKIQAPEPGETPECTVARSLCARIANGIPLSVRPSHYIDVANLATSAANTLDAANGERESRYRSLVPGVVHIIVRNWADAGLPSDVCGRNAADRWFACFGRPREQRQAIILMAQGLVARYPPQSGFPVIWTRPSDGRVVVFDGTEDPAAFASSSMAWAHAVTARVLRMAIKGQSRGINATLKRDVPDELLLVHPGQLLAHYLSHEIMPGRIQGGMGPT
jgi:hypothetical protein